MRHGLWCVRWRGVPVVPSREVAGGSGQQRLEVRERWATGGAQEAGGPDCDDALWQDMREDAAEACCGGKRSAVPLVACPLLAAAGAGPIFTLFEAVVGESQATDVGGEGGDDRGAGASGCTGGDPWLTPDVDGPGTEPVGWGAFLRALPPADCRQRAPRHQPVRITGEEPAGTLWRQGPAWDERMDRWRRGHLSGPGMQPAPHAHPAAAGFGVEGERLQSGSGGGKAPGVHPLVVRAGHGAQCLGQGKGDENIGHGQQERPLRVEPPGGVVVLALGPRAMLAGMVAVLACLTLCALGDLPAERCGAALCNGRHGSQVALGPPVAAAGAGGGSRTPEEVGQLDQGRPRETRRGRSGVP